MFFFCRCLVMVQCCVIISQMSAAAALITNCSAYKHDPAGPRTVIPADASALPSVRTNAVSECKAAHPNASCPSEGPVSSRGRNRSQLLKVQRRSVDTPPPRSRRSQHFCVFEKRFTSHLKSLFSFFFFFSWRGLSGSELN